jgi:hypothetical protein
MEVIMVRKNIVIASALAAALSIGLLGSTTIAQPYGGWGMRGGGYGPGMMGGYGPGWMHGGRGGHGPCWGDRDGYGPGAYGQRGDLKLSTDDVKARLERWITWQGNPRLKVGDVKEKDADTIEADIVTKDNSLVQRFAVNRHTGFYRPTENE